MDLISRSYRIQKNHDVAIKRVAKKLKLSESEVVRRRITPYTELLKELQEDMKHADFISRKNLLK